MRKIIIAGGGGFARELLSWAIACMETTGDLTIIGYADDAGPMMSGYSGISIPYLGRIVDLVLDDVEIALAVGEPASKKAVDLSLADRGARFASLIHPSAQVARDAHLAEGVVIGPLTYVATNSALGRLASVNSLSGIGHDAQVGTYATISSQVDIMGGVDLDEGVFVGSGARILPKIKVGAAARIGAGAIVVRTVKAGQTIFSAPARSL